MMLRGCLACLGTTVQAGMSLIDAHLHYNAADEDAHTPHLVLESLERNGVLRAAVTSSPPERVLELQRLAPARIVPLLGVYRSPEDKEDWHGDASNGRVGRNLIRPQRKRVACRYAALPVHVMM